MANIAIGVDKFDILEDNAGYARPPEEYGEAELSHDHVGNLEKLREMLIRRRRYLLQDTILYPSTYLGRAADLAKLQPLVDAAEAALAHERALTGEAVAKP